MCQINACPGLFQRGYHRFPFCQLVPFWLQNLEACSVHMKSGRNTISMNKKSREITYPAKTYMTAQKLAFFQISINYSSKEFDLLRNMTKMHRYAFPFWCLAIYLLASTLSQIVKCPLYIIAIIIPKERLIISLVWIFTIFISVINSVNLDLLNTTIVTINPGLQAATFRKGKSPYDIYSQRIYVS